jgi:hypothetical protein
MSRSFFIYDILDTACRTILPLNEASTSFGRTWPQTQAVAF